MRRLSPGLTSAVCLTASTILGAGATPAAAQNPEPTTAAPSDSAALVRPLWTRRPDMKQVMAAYPRGAHGVGQAVVSCRVDADGKLNPCEVVAESASGFGASGLRLAKLFRMRTVDADGVPVAGRTIRVPFRLYPAS